MHKITKGLKKKKKNKKHKKGEDDLFDSAELEKYRQQKENEAVQQQQGEASSGAVDNDEWKQFKALTAGVDSVLKKTQGDLDRIKSTSFFQRKPAGTPAEEPGRPERPPAPVEKKKKGKRWVGFEEGSLGIDAPPPEELEDESEEATVDELLGSEPGAEVEQPQPHEEETEEDEDEEVDEDIFDTSYVDVITSGEVKLAYIPDSPTQEEQDFDPFDTSIADNLIREPEKKKGLVSLGCAVDVLTGRLDKVEGIPPEAVGSPAKKRRPIPRRPQHVDLLLDEDAAATPVDDLEGVTPSAPEQPRSLLDEESELDIPAVAPPLSGPAPVEEEEGEQDKVEEKDLKHLVAEFDLISSTPEPVVEQPVVEDDLEDEFAALAAESVAKKPPPPAPEDPEDPFDTSTASVDLGDPQIQSQFPTSPDVDLVLSQNWTNFEEQENTQAQDDLAILALAEDLQIDPFDTSFAENILPGKVELKLIENEILGDLEVVNEARILSRSDSDSEQPVQSTVSIHITDPAGQEEDTGLRSLTLGHRDLLGGSTTDLSKDQGEEEDDSGLRSLTLGHRDLLGGSTTDLTKLGHDPIQPAAPQEHDEEEVDPFDTSVVEVLAAPGKAELKFLEKELLEEPQGLVRTLSDPDFDPRDEENLQKADPFDTSVVEVLAAPGKAELKFLEKELLEEPQGLVRTLSDPDFDPRAEEQPAPARPDLLIVEPVTKTVAFDLPTPSSRPDLLAVGEDEQSTATRKPLTPYHVEDVKPAEVFVTSRDGVDPFDTSFAENILPGKAELKLIESELVGLKHSLSDPDFNPRDGEQQEVTEAQQQASSSNVGRRFSDLTGDRQRRQPPPNTLPIRSTVAEVKVDLLVVEDATAVPVKPLTPTVEDTEVSAEDDIDYVDPFDTSIANNILPGKAELKVLESELINTSLKRSYTDPDFNPRGEEESPEPLETTPDLLNLPTCAQVADKTLTPVPPEVEDEEPEIDPFDTSIANDIAPGRAELRALESELIG